MIITATTRMKITMGAEFQRSFVYLFCLPVEFMVLCQIVANRVFIVFLMVAVVVAIIMTGFRLAKIVDRHKRNLNQDIFVGEQKLE